LYLAQLLRANPLMAIALLICLATILWCILLTRRQRNSFDKTLTGLVGLFAIYESVHILKDSHFAIFAKLQTIEGWVDLVSACLYLLATLIVKNSSMDRVATRVQLRLMEADEKQTTVTGGAIGAMKELGYPLVDSCPLAIFALDDHGSVWYVNAAAESLTGWKRNELLSHELPFDPKGPIQGKDKTFIEAAIWTAPIRPSHGRPRGTMIIAAGIDRLQDAGLELSSAPKQGLEVHI